MCCVFEYNLHTYVEQHNTRLEMTQNFLKETSLNLTYE